jgi:hypothetical protein
LIGGNFIGDLEPVAARAEDELLQHGHLVLKLRYLLLKISHL